MTTTSLVEVSSLTKRYKETTALEGLTFRLKKGEALGLLGANGAGKTTAIHIFLGLLTPTSGHVSIFGFSPLTQRHLIAPRINFSSAYVSMPGNLKVREILKVYSLLYGVKNWKKKAEEVLELFEITHLLGRLTGALSSGEKTRLNLCKALLNDPEILFLDEPTASMDPDVADTVKTTLKRIQKERDMSLIYTSHNMKEVEAICDRILFLHEGKTVAEGTTGEVKAKFGEKSLEDVFIRIVRG